MARKRTTPQAQAEEEESEQNSRREIHEEEAETNTSHQNMNEEEAKTSNRINIDEEERGSGGLVMVKVNKGVKALNEAEIVCECHGYLNFKQKKDIIEMGFGALLNFKMNYIPRGREKEGTDRCGEDGRGLPQTVTNE